MSDWLKIARTSPCGQTTVYIAIQHCLCAKSAAVFSLALCSSLQPATIWWTQHDFLRCYCQHYSSSCSYCPCCNIDPPPPPPLCWGRPLLTAKSCYFHLLICITHSLLTELRSANGASFYYFCQVFSNLPVFGLYCKTGKFRDVFVI